MTAQVYCSVYIKEFEAHNIINTEEKTDGYDKTTLTEHSNVLYRF